MTTTHDYDAALESINDECKVITTVDSNFPSKQNINSTISILAYKAGRTADAERLHQTIRHALRVAKALQGEPSEGMTRVGAKVIILRKCNKHGLIYRHDTMDIFKSMAAVLLKECE